LSQAGAHARKRKFHRVGRHAAPTPLAKAAKRAGQVAPAVAVAGAIATAPHFYLQATTSPSALAGDIASAGRAYLNQYAPEPHRHVPTVSAHAARPARAGQAGRAAKDRRADAKAAPAKSSDRGEPASPRHARAQHHHAAASPARPSPATPTCSGTGGMLPENYQAIVSFLMAHGYTGLAAAGIAGNIYQESKGDPEAIGTGGGGLIGWTPLPSGLVTGNPAADLQTQLQALLTYNEQWAQYIPMLNAATSPTEAADIYMNYFERPGIPAAYNRESAAAAVAAACHL
jgi:hypothetical protein